MSRLSLLLIVALCLSIGVIIIDRGVIRGLNDNFRSSQNLHRAAVEDGKYWRDKEGKSHVRAIVAESNLEVAKSTLGDELKALAKEVSGLKRNIKNLKSYITVGVTTSGSATTGLIDTVVMKDSSARAFKWNDKWTEVAGVIQDTTVSLEYRVRDSLTFVSYYRSNGLFRPRSLMIDAISHNPNSTITGIKNTKITSLKRRRPRPGFYAGYGIGPAGLSPQVGVGLVY